MSAPRRQRLAWVCAAGVLAVAAASPAAPPQIAQVYPDFPVHGPRHRLPRIITGEHLDADGVELWTWQPPSSEEIIRRAASRLADGVPDPPATPPKGAHRVSPLDVQPRVLLAELSGSVLWAKGPDGCSRPYLFNVARPFWLSAERACAGDRVHVFGFGLRREHEGPRTYAPRPKSTLALIGGDQPLLVAAHRQARSTVWTDDPRLVFFRLPADTPPGEYTAYVHSGVGGAHGWAKAGALEVVARDPAEPKVFSVARFGASGDDLADDTAALAKALAAAARAGGGVAFLPPGTYRVRHTLTVPAGVTLRGASRDAAVIEGFADRPVARNARAVIDLRDAATLAALTVRGAVAEGPRGGAMITLTPRADDAPVDDVSILNCRLIAQEEDDRAENDLYWNCLWFRHARRLKIVNNDIRGSIFFHRGDRMEVIRNTFRGGTFSIVVSIHGWVFDSLLDANRFIDTPGRVCFYPRRHSYIRFNEVHHAGRATWANAGEVYLVHGQYAGGKTVGRPTAAGGRRLTDRSQSWAPGRLKDAVVLVTAGRGFGQYRTVSDNTTDTLILDRPWRVDPDAGSEYVVGPLYLENAFRANLNNTPMILSLWLDCVANVVERHRDVFSSGLTLWSRDGSWRDEDGAARDVNHFSPSYYNMVVNGWMDGSQVSLSIGARADNVNAGPGMFGNYFVHNKIRSPHLRRVAHSHAWPHVGGIKVGRVPKDPNRLRDDRVGASHTVISDNAFTFTNVGVMVSDVARKTFILRNTFQQVAHPILDWGARTRIAGNSTHVVDANGLRRVGIPDATNRREIHQRTPLVLRGFRRSGRKLTCPVTVPLANPGDADANARLTWRRPAGCRWRVTPADAEVAVPAGRTRAARFELAFDGPLRQVYPLPSVETVLTVAGRPPHTASPPVAIDLRGFLRQRPCAARCPRTDAPPKIDGRLDDDAWARATRLAGLVTPAGSPGEHQPTEVRLLHDGRSLYLAVRCADEDIAHLRTAADGRDGPVYRDDAVEVFVDANHDRRTYHQFIANAAGAVFDAATRDRAWDGQWRAATGREEGEGRAGAWTLEIAIPFHTVGLGRPAAGTTIGLNVVRFRPRGRQRSMWSPTFSGTNHVPARFGALTLE
jgi:hypothetical protein